MHIREIQETVLFHGSQCSEEEALQVPGAEPINWVHPKVAMVPGNPPVAHLLMTGVSGIDVFTPVHHMISRDLGETWSRPADPEALGYRWLGRGNIETLADMVPKWHPPTRRMLAIGACTVYWGARINLNVPVRGIPYSVLNPDTEEWLPWKKLAPPKGFPMTGHLSSGCSQYEILSDGDVLLPIVGVVAPDRLRRHVAVLRCTFDGVDLRCNDWGNLLTLPVGRGLLEPSICCHSGRFLMTIRAEDGHMYHSTSSDGLIWEPPQRWAWTDGQPIETHTTQQHWITHSDGLFLAYTRKMDSNLDVFRYRSPLLAAQVDLSTMTLKPDTERVLMRNQGVRLGNHMVTHVSEDETWVTDAEWQGNNRDVLLTRIYWKQPNKLATDVCPPSHARRRQAVTMA